MYYIAYYLIIIMKTIGILSVFDFVRATLDPDTKLQITTCGFAGSEGPCTFVESRRIDEHLIHLNRRGATIARIAGEAVPIPSGSLLWIQPGVEQEIHLSSGSATVAYMRFCLGGPSGSLRLKKNAILCHLARWADGSMENLCQVRKRPGRIETFARRAVFVRLICDILQRYQCSESNSVGLQPNQQHQSLKYIHDNIDRRYSIANLAAHCQLNPAYFARQFKASFNQSPQEYIKRARVHAAAEVLQETGLTISQVAYQFGYRDVYFFSRQFKSVMGQSPRSWRRAGERPYTTAAALHYKLGIESVNSCDTAVSRVQ